MERNREGSKEGILFMREERIQNISRKSLPILTANTRLWRGGRTSQLYAKAFV